jgi:hypothetical protein
MSSGADNPILIFKASAELMIVDALKNLAIKNGNIFATALRLRLQASMNESDQALATAQVLFFTYFDEAHVLTVVDPIEGHPPRRSKYSLLGRLLGKMDQLPFFAVFLSTNSWLGSFAPSSSKHQSLRDWDNVILHAPFTELPFDTFGVNAFGNLSAAGQGVQLTDVCTVDYIVKFGRPL